MAVTQTSPGRRSLESLLAGNRRFQSDPAPRADRSLARSRALLFGQSPVAIVVSCSDSRLSPEVLFDQGIGDLFAVRTAGHVLDLAGLASIEYAVAHLHVPLLLVLGHSRCGAIFSALTGSLATPSEERLAAAIAPAIAATPVDPDVPLDVRVDRVARTHAAGTATWLLDRSDVLARAAAHHLLVCAGFYDLDSGAVTLLSSASARRE